MIAQSAMNSSQLSLFNTKTATGTQYKAGDWIKLRRKAKIAAWVKRGEVFRVNQVHPIDGSLKFWNPHINQWDFLYPEEVKLTAEPVVEEVAVAKLTAEPVVEDSTHSGTAYKSNGWIDYHYKIRTDGKQQSIRHRQPGCTGPYYSYRWLEGKIQRSKYVPKQKFGAAYKAIAIGEPISKILEIINQ